MPESHSKPSVAARWPEFSNEEVDAALEVLRSGRVNYWTGDNCVRFEKEFAQYFESPYAVAACNGTVTLDLALRAANVRPGDEIIVTPRSFVASASAASVLGAKPVFADVDSDSQNITASTIEPLINDRTRAIIPVHLNGWPCEMSNILELAETYDLQVIEDCAQAHGAKIHGRCVGSFGHFGSFSFCQDKIMTTGGEGGMLLVRESDAFEKCRSFKDHGKNFAKLSASANTPGFSYVHDQIGTNYRMTEMQAAIGRQQLAKLEDWVRVRNENANKRCDALAHVSALRIPKPDSRLRHSYYKFYIFVDLNKLRKTWTRDRILAEFVEAGVRCFSGSCPEIYKESAFSGNEANVQRLPIAKKLGETSLMFLVDPTISDETIQFESEVIERVMRRACR